LVPSTFPGIWENCFAFLSAGITESQQGMGNVPTGCFRSRFQVVSSWGMMCSKYRVFQKELYGGIPNFTLTKTFTLKDVQTKMFEPRRVTILLASTACCRHSCTFTSPPPMSRLSIKWDLRCITTYGPVQLVKE
jgi:hypothetical protein